MNRKSELIDLLSKVYFNQSYNTIEGIDPFRHVCNQEKDDEILLFLLEKLPSLEGKVYDGILYVIVEHYLQNSQYSEIQNLYFKHTGSAKVAVLNGLWDKSSFGAVIIELAIDGAHSSDENVRKEACSVIQNQAAWEIDVSTCVGRLQELLSDESKGVRMQAECAVGNLANKKYQLTSCIPQLCQNTRDADRPVREYAAWALWQLSRNKYNIEASVANLTWLLSDISEYHDLRKNAIGALLHHAKKSGDNAKTVLDSVARIELNRSFNEIKKFELKLNDLE